MNVFVRKNITHTKNQMDNFFLFFIIQQKTKQNTSKILSRNFFLLSQNRLKNHIQLPLALTEHSQSSRDFCPVKFAFKQK
jgi:predicted N-acyltransferase